MQSNQIEPKEDVILTCDEWGMLHCKRVHEEQHDDNLSVPFSLLPALEDGYFSDITLVANNNREVWLKHLHVLLNSWPKCSPLS